MSEPSIYAKAIDVLLRDGWAPGGMVDSEDGGACAWLALQRADASFAAKDTADRELIRIFGGIVAVFRWNDAPERTKEDVILLLKYADAGELETWKSLYGPDAEDTITVASVFKFENKVSVQDAASGPVAS